MTIENAKSFIKKFNNDHAFRAEISQAGTGKEWLGIAQKAGFDFEENELDQVLQESTGQMDDELAEDELEAVSGGVMSFDGKGNDVVTEEITFFRNGGKKLIGMLEGGR